jgi:hypothetical protein
VRRRRGAVRGSASRRGADRGSASAGQSGSWRTMPLGYWKTLGKDLMASKRVSFFWPISAKITKSGRLALRDCDKLTVVPFYHFFYSIEKIKKRHKVIDKIFGDDEIIVVVVVMVLMLKTFQKDIYQVLF